MTQPLLPWKGGLVALFLLATALPAGAAILTFPGCGATLQDCITTAAPGDAILVATNTPINQSLTIQKSLTLQAGIGFTPTLTAGNSVFVSNVSGTSSTFTIRGLTLLGGGIRGLQGGSGSMTVNILDNVVTGSPAINVGAGSSQGTGNIIFTIRGNRVMVPTSLSGSGQSSGISAGGGGPNPGATGVIQGNIISMASNAQGAAINLSNGGQTLTVDVLGNAISGTNYDEGISLFQFGPGGSMTARVINNLITGQNGNVGAPAGIAVIGDEGTTTVSIVNNTVAGNRLGVLIGGRPDLGAVLQGTVGNNIIANNSERGLAIDAFELTVSNSFNLVFGNTSDSFTPGAGTIMADPQFVGGGNFRLQPSSPAVNAGSNALVPSDIIADLDNKARILGPAVDIGAFEVGPRRTRAYVTNGGSVSVIDTASNTVVTTVGVASGAVGVAITPDGDRAYVPGAGSTVSVIDTAMNAVVATVGVGQEHNVGGVAITPDGTRVYVTNTQSGSVSVIDTASNTVVATVGVGIHPFGVAITPDGTRAYVTNGDSFSVSVIDTASNTVVATVQSGALFHFPFGVAITPDGTRAYVVNGGVPFVSVIDTATNMVVATVGVGSAARGVAITPDGTRAYVTNQGSVSVIDTASNTVMATVGVGGFAGGMAITPDGTRAYVTNGGSVSVIDTASNTVMAAVGVGGGAAGVAITPADNPVPSITSLSPSSALVGGEAFTLTVNGNNFLPSSTILWNAQPRTPTFVNATRLELAISATDIASAGTVPVTVVNPLPGGFRATATFTISPTFVLSVVRAGSGSGTVTSTPGGITCGSTCSARFEGGAQVVLTAAPGATSTFAGWSGCDAVSGAQCTVALTSTKTVTATFEPLSGSVRLTITKAGTGSGAVTSPTGISCAGSCSHVLNQGTALTLTALPDSGSTFTGWSGSCSGTGPCMLTLTADTTVTATFTAPSQQFALVVVLRGSTSAGSVLISPPATTCVIPSCATLHPSGTPVTLTAQAGLGASFKGWVGGGCSGTGACTVSMTAMRSVVAIFSRVFTNPDPTARTSIIRAADIFELRAAVSNLFLNTRFETPTFTDPTVSVGSTVVKAVHFTELRTALGQVAGQAGVTLPSYTDSVLTPGVSVIRAVDLNELRSAVRRLE